MVQYLAVPPTNWPQDTYQIPTAQADKMPPTGRVNKELVQQESSIMTLNIPAYNPPTGLVTTTILPTDQDGDFWCDQIFVAGYGADGVFFLGANTLGFADLRTGRSLTYGADPPLEYWRNSFMFNDPLPPNNFNGLPFPSLYRNTGTLPQPFCFTRQGGIIVTLTSLGSAPTVDLSITLAGWKEYSYGA